MNQEKADHLKFLKQQLDECKEQDRMLGEIETVLYKMKQIAKYAAENKLQSCETKDLKDEMDQLTEKVIVLKKQLYPSQIIN